VIASSSSCDASPLGSARQVESDWVLQCNGGQLVRRTWYRASARYRRTSTTKERPGTRVRSRRRRGWVRHRLLSTSRGRYELFLTRNPRCASAAVSQIARPCGRQVLGDYYFIIAAHEGAELLRFLIVSRKRPRLSNASRRQPTRHLRLDRKRPAAERGLCAASVGLRRIGRLGELLAATGRLCSASRAAEPGPTRRHRGTPPNRRQTMPAPGRIPAGGRRATSSAARRSPRVSNAARGPARRLRRHGTIS